MKFGEELSSHLTPEWRKQYIDYKALKTLLYQGLEGRAIDGTPTDDAESARLLAKVSYSLTLINYVLKHDNFEVDETFFSLIDEELIKVNLFFSQKLAEAKGKLNELSQDLHIWKASTKVEQKRAGSIR